jgi:hypothetical protein
MAICTLVNAGYPHALAAVLADDFDVRPLLLSRSATCRKADEAAILGSRAVITGDLPANPFANCQSEIEDWVAAGGVLIHYTGWKDFRFLPQVPSLFSVTVAPQQPMRREPVPTRIRGAWGPAAWALPPTYFLTHASPAGKAEVLMESAEGRPVLIRTPLGAGATYLFLAPISLPAGEAWAYWSDYPDLITHLTGLPRSGGGTSTDPALAAYTAAHQARRAGDLPKAHRLFLDTLSRARTSNVTLSIEAAQMVRAVGKDARDPVAVLLGFRTVTDLIGGLEPADETYDYCADQQPWYEVRHRLDEINYLGRDPEASARRAEACFAAMDDRPASVGGLDASYTEGLRHLLRSLLEIFEFGRTVEPGASLNLLPLIERELAIGSTKTYQHPQSEVFRHAIALLKTHIPFFPVDDDMLAAANAARTRLATVTVREFGSDVRHLLDIVETLDDYEDDPAWGHAVRIEQPGLRALAVGILTLRARLRREPLVVASVPDYAARQRVMQAITRLQGLKNERRAATIRLLLSTEASFDGSGLVPLSLSLELRHVEEIVKYAPAFELFVFDRDGQCVGALPHDRIRPYEQHKGGTGSSAFLVSAASARLAGRTRETGAGVTIDATMRTTLFARGQPVAHTIGTRWAPWNPKPLQVLRDGGASSAAAEAICRRVLTIIEDHFPIYHGGSVVLASSRRKLPRDGKALGSGVRLSEISDPDLAALLAVDGSLWVNPDPDPLIRKVGCKLPSPMPAAEDLTLIAGRGTRHRAATTYATRRGVPVLIFSADTAATYVSRRAGIVRLW